MTSEPRRLASKLTEGSDMSAAALLVAMAGDEAVEIQKEDLPLLQQLEREGLVRDGVVTSLGSQVVLVLRAVDGIEAG